MLIIQACGAKKEPEKPAPKILKLKVATYNLNYFTGGYAGIRDTISAMKPDIIALQEVLLSQGTDYSKKLAKDLGYHHASSTPYVGFDNIKWITAFLSAYPIKKTDQTKLGYSRNALRISVDLEGTALTLVTMHLTPFIWADSNLLQANKNMSKLRQREIADLMKWTGKMEPPAIFLGDFNSLPFMGELTPIMSLGYRDVYTEVENGIEGTFMIQKSVRAVINRALPGYSIPENIKLDYILISDAIKAVKVEVPESKASDHRPLSAEIIIERPDKK